MARKTDEQYDEKEARGRASQSVLAAQGSAKLIFEICLLTVTRKVDGPAAVSHTEPIFG
jgi:hypothetical protein